MRTCTVTPGGKTISKLRAPKDWQFTPEQLTPIIAAKHPGAYLSRVTLINGSEGTSSRARIGLEYARGTGPAAVFVKSQGDIWHRLLHFMTGNLYREALLDGSGVTVPVEHPAEYFGQVDRARLNELVIMEDLCERGVTLHDATQPVSVEAVALGLRALPGSTAPSGLSPPRASLRLTGWKHGGRHLASA